MQKMQIVITDKELELVKSAVLYDLYGQINRGDLKNVQNNLLGQEELALKRRTDLWEHLIKEKVIDPKGRLWIHDVHEITENTGLNSKLKFSCEKLRNASVTFASRVICWILSTDNSTLG